MAKKVEKTKVYKPKALIDGAKLGQDGTWVAIPDKYRDKTIAVLYGGMQMTIRNWHKAEMFKRFHDKFATTQNGRPTTYTLGYFRFVPDGD